jgi:cytochrome P450
MIRTVGLTDLDMWARGVPYDEFARLRREAQVAWHDEAPPNSGFWSVHCYQDIVTASRDVARFSSGRGISFEEPTDEDMRARRTIIDTDPPEHTKLRKIVSGSFSRRAVAVYEHFVAGLPSMSWTPGWPGTRPPGSRSPRASWPSASTPTGTSASGAAGPTCAWALTWLGWRCAWCWKR